MTATRRRCSSLARNLSHPGIIAKSEEIGKWNGLDGFLIASGIGVDVRVDLERDRAFLCLWPYIIKTAKEIGACSGS